jgi:hypothetical protein
VRGLVQGRDQGRPLRWVADEPHDDLMRRGRYNDVVRQEADLTAGHRILRTPGLVAVIAQDPDELERGVADIEQPAIQASCETRRLWGPAGSGVRPPACRSAWQESATLVGASGRNFHLSRRIESAPRA